jgi:hypothetical protein
MKNLRSMSQATNAARDLRRGHPEDGNVRGVGSRATHPATVHGDGRPLPCNPSTTDKTGRNP